MRRPAQFALRRPRQRSPSRIPILQKCGQPVAATLDARFPTPQAYTPKHLAERILTSKAALEGEGKQVTVLFADLKGSMELLADRDPDEARKLLDPVLEHMLEAVHRYEGRVNQVMGDGIMALFGPPPWPTRIMRCGRAMPRLGCLNPGQRGSRSRRDWNNP